MKKLHRSRSTKVLGGVAAGFAEYFSTDITVMRLLFALVAVTIPSSILAYILAWLIIPENSLETPAAPRETTTPRVGDTNLPPTAEELLGDKGGPAPAPQAPQAARPVEPERNRQLFGYILIVVGVIVLTRRFVPSFLWRLPTQIVGQAWPVLIILAGAALIFGAVRGR